MHRWCPALCCHLSLRISMHLRTMSDVSVPEVARAEGDSPGAPCLMGAATAAVHGRTLSACQLGRIPDSAGSLQAGRSCGSAARWMLLCVAQGRVAQSQASRPSLRRLTPGSTLPWSTPLGHPSTTRCAPEGGHLCACGNVDSATMTPCSLCVLDIEVTP